MIFRYVLEKYRNITRLSDEIKKLFKMALIVGGFFEIIKIIPTYIFKEIIDGMVAYDPATGITAKLVFYLIAGYFASFLAMTIIEIIAARYRIAQIRKSETDIMAKAFKKLLSLDIKYHEDNNTGILISKVIKGGSKIVDLLFQIVDRTFPIALQTLITLATLLFVNVEMSLLFIIFVPIFLFLLIHSNMATQKSREKMHYYHDEYAGAITQSIANIRTVKNFGNEAHEERKSEKYLSKYAHYLDMRTRYGLRGRMFEDILVNVARICTLALSVWLMIKMQITAGMLVFIMTLTEKAYINLSQLSRVYYNMQDSEPSIDRFNSIKDETAKIKDNPDSKTQIMTGDVDFNHVSFKYENTASHALKNVNFSIPSKSVAAFVGRSGSGKSTVIKLLLRQFDVNSGKIKIDNADIRDYSLKNLRKNIAVVSQDVELFNETIADNIAYGIENAPMKDIVSAAKMAHADIFIKKFRKGYNTTIGERGVRLSGGQKQRIAIARAILRKPKILIFDEATSSLDSESEKYIHKSIFNLIGKTTLIIIAHRFSTIEHADKIILLDNGEVKEIGTHSELMKKRGIFSKLRNLQRLE